MLRFIRMLSYKTWPKYLEESWMSNDDDHVFLPWTQELPKDSHSLPQVLCVQTKELFDEKIKDSGILDIDKKAVGGQINQSAHLWIFDIVTLKTMNCQVSWSCISNQSKGLTQWLHTVKLRLHSIVGEVRMRVPPDLWKWSKRQPWIFLCKDLWEWKRLTSRVQLNHTNKKIKTWFCIKPTRCYHLRRAADVATTWNMFCVKCCHFYLFLAFLKK